VFLAPTLDADPVWSPDGGAIAFSRTRSGLTAIYVVAPEGGAPRRLATGRRPQWAPDGQRIGFVRAGRIGVVEVDTGRAADVAQGSAFAWTDANAIAVVSGLRLLAVSAAGSQVRELLRVARPSRPECSVELHGPELSRDGRSIALLVENAAGVCGQLEIVVLPSAGGPLRTLHVHQTGGSTSEGPAWSPDGRSLVFSDGEAGLKGLASSGGLLPWPDVLGVTAAWASDGSAIAYANPFLAGAADRSRLYLLRVDAHTPRRLTRGGDDRAPQWEPG
jgi:Tol biopolymer transport system component